MKIGKKSGDWLTIYQMRFEKMSGLTKANRVSRSALKNFMKVTLNWLKQYVDFDWSPEELADPMLGLPGPNGSRILET
jgi:hypothetical protein